MLTTSQITALRTAILSEIDAEFILFRSQGSTGQMVEWFNQPSTTVVWKTSVPKNEVGKAFQATALAAITAGNNDKLANFAAWNDVIDPSRADQRGFFSDVFSVAAGAPTRTALDALWRRQATRGEKIFAVGTGTTLAPSTLDFEGQITNDDVVRAVNP